MKSKSLRNANGLYFFLKPNEARSKDDETVKLEEKWGQIPGSSSRLIFENKKINNKKILSLPNILMCLFYEFAGKFHSICADFRRMNCLYVKNDKSPPCVIYTCLMPGEWWINIWMNTKLVQSIYCLLTQVHPNLTFENIHCLNCIHFRNNKAQLNENVAL